MIKIRSVLQHKHDLTFNMFTVNTRSVLGKSINIRNFILENDCLAGVITETWLNREKELDVELCDLNIQGFKLDAVNRKGRKGGGLALVYRQHCAVRKLCHRSFPSMEIGFWSICYQNTTLNILGIYRPPYSTKNNITDNQFVDEFLELLADLLPEYNNITILGDLNVHWNDDSNPLIGVLKDSLTVLSLNQLVNEYTHNSGNILDVAIVESDNIDASCQVLDFLSDHRYVLISRHLVKNSVSFKKKQFRDIKNINKELLRTRCSNIVIDETCDNISSIATKFDEDLIKILDDFAPEKIKVIKDHPPKPWISEEIIQVRKDYRKCVKVGLKVALILIGAA